MSWRWQAGAQVVLREIWRGRVWSGRPVTVVQDMPELVALHIPPGTRWRPPRMRDGRPLRVPGDDWVLGDAVWFGGTLRLTQPGAAHSVEALFNEKGAFVCWYVNLEEPLRRTAMGFDYMDQTLDIVIAADLSAWWWKDEDEFAEAQAKGIYSPEQARAIRAEGERVIEVVRAGGPPFSDGWERWRPDPGWSLPTLPAGWDALGE